MDSHFVPVSTSLALINCQPLLIVIIVLAPGCAHKEPVNNKLYTKGINFKDGLFHFFKLNAGETETAFLGYDTKCMRTFFQ